MKRADDRRVLRGIVHALKCGRCGYALPMVQFFLMTHGNPGAVHNINIYGNVVSRIAPDRRCCIS